MVCIDRTKLEEEYLHCFDEPGKLEELTNGAEEHDAKRAEAFVTADEECRYDTVIPFNALVGEPLRLEVEAYGLPSKRDFAFDMDHTTRVQGER